MNISEMRPYILLSIVVMGISLTIGTIFGFMIRPTTAPSVVNNVGQQGVLTDATATQRQAPLAGEAVPDSQVPSKILSLSDDVFVIRKLDGNVLTLATSTDAAKTVKIALNDQTTYVTREKSTPGTGEIAAGIRQPPTPGAVSPASVKDLNVGLTVEIHHFSLDGVETALSVAILEQ